MKDVDISKHDLVPKHILLSKEEAQKILQKYNINPNQLPSISKKDPMLVGLDAKPGDIIRIIRKSETAKEFEFFRLVSHD